MKKRGFTLIELIVVISIISLLIGVLVPSFNAVKRQAKSLGQKSQLRNIEIGLEVWRNSHDLEYPDSNAEGTTSVTYGAHKLAEALVGRDLLGFDNKSTWDAAADDGNPEIYALPVPGVKDTRDDAHVELNSLDVAQMSQVTEPGATTDAYLGNIRADGSAGSNDDPAYVFTDIFRTKKIVDINEGVRKIGTPILYYKANISSNIWDDSAEPQIFEFDDNVGMMEFGHIIENTTKHPYFTDPTLFFEFLINPKYSGSGIDLPYNKESFLLLSAGWDGLYGTRDDIWNISK